MMWGWNDGAWGIVWMALSWAAVIALVWFVVRAFAGRDDQRPKHPDPKEVLADRFARGEIDEKEYGERLRVLEEHTSA